MVSRLIEHQKIGSVKHHAGEHTTNLFTTGQNLDRLEYTVSREKHTAKESAQVCLGLILGILTHPIENAQITILKILGVIMGEVRGRDADTPAEGTCIRLNLFHQHTEEGSNANHLDTTNASDGMKFGADYAGYLRRSLQEEYGEDVVVLFLNGCCANVNHYDYKNHYCRTAHCRPGVIPAEEIGIGLAQTVKNLCPPILTEAKDIRIEGAAKMYMVSRRKADRTHKEWAKKTVAAMEAGAEVRKREQILADLYLHEDPTTPNTVDIEILTLQIGPWTIVGLPGEIYSDIGLKIKANSPFANTIVVEIVNGYNGYISPDTIQRAGNYEGIYSMVAYTGFGSADTLIHGATDMLYALYYSDNQDSFGGLRPKPLD